MEEKERQGSNAAAHPELVTTKRDLKEVSLKAEDVAFIDHLKRNTTHLRHSLKKADASNSGYVNGPEFRSTLFKQGYTQNSDKLMKQLFDSSAEGSKGGTKLGTYTRWQDAPECESKGKVVDTEKFLKRLVCTRTSSDQNLLLSAKDLEERRILRRALQVTRGSSNSYALLKELSAQTPGRLEIDRMKEGLAILGANLSASDMDVVVEKVGVKPDGRIDLGDFDQKLYESIEFFDKIASKSSYDRLHKHPRYSQSVQCSSSCLISPGDEDFNKFENALLHSKACRKDQVTWSKVQRALQDGSKSIIQSLRPESDLDNGGVGRRFTVDRLLGKLSDAGILLGDEDATRLKSKLQQFEDGRIPPSTSECPENPLVSLEAFCEVAGVKPGMGRRGKLDAGSENDDFIEKGGVFYSSRHSILGNPSYSVSSLQSNRSEDLGLPPKYVKRYCN